MEISALQATDPAVLLTMCFISFFLLFEAGDLGLALIAPLVGKEGGDGKILARLGRPAFELNELWLLAACLLMTLDELNWGESRRYWLYVGGAILVLGMVLRAVQAWYPQDGIGKKKGLFLLNGFLASVSIFYLTIGNTALFMSTDLGVTATDHMLVFLPGILYGGWVWLAAVANGALYAAWKTANPLRERCRATALIGSFLLLVMEGLTLLYLWLMPFADLHRMIITMGILSIMLSAAFMFVSARRRLVGAALAFSVLHNVLACLLYVAAIYRGLALSLDPAAALAYIAEIRPLDILIVLAVVGGICGGAAKLCCKKMETSVRRGWNKSAERQ